MSYSISQDVDQRRFFPKKLVSLPDGRTKSISFPIKIDRRFLTLTHSCGDSVTLTAYLYRGSWHYRDSREPKRSFSSSDHVVGEICRMLEIKKEEVSALLPC